MPFDLAKIAGQLAFDEDCGGVAGVSTAFADAANHFFGRRLQPQTAEGRSRFQDHPGDSSPLIERGKTASPSTACPAASARPLSWNNRP